MYFSHFEVFKCILVILDALGAFLQFRDIMGILVNLKGLGLFL